MSEDTSGLSTETLSALAEPNRMHIVELLRDKPLPVGEIASSLKMRQPQASKHLRVLSDAGLVEMHPHAQKHVFALKPAKFKEMHHWLEDYRELWEERLDRLDAYLEKIQKEPKANAKKTKQRPTRRINLH